MTPVLDQHLLPTRKPIVECCITLLQATQRFQGQNKISNNNKFVQIPDKKSVHTKWVA